MDVLSRLRQAIGAQDRSNSKEGGDRPTTNRSNSDPKDPGTSRERKKREHRLTGAAFRDTWIKVKATLAHPDQAALHHGIARTDLKALLQDLSDALVSEANRADEQVDVAGPCMEMLLEGDILGQLVRLTANDRIAGSQAEVVRLFATLIILLDQRFLSRQAVHRPLVRLMRICIGDESHTVASDADLNRNDVDTGDEEGQARRRFGRMGSAEALGFGEQLVELMCHVASRLRNSPELLIIFFRERGGDEQSRRAFNVAMSGSSGTPSRVSTRAPSPNGTGSPQFLQTTRSSQPAISSPLRPLDASPSSYSWQLADAPHSSEARSQASSVAGLPYDFPLFLYLMRFIHRESRMGELARAGILFLVDVAFAPGRRNLSRTGKARSKALSGRISGPHASVERSPRSPRDASGRRSGTSTPQRARIDADLGLGPSTALARFMLESDFTEVLGAGLGAAYGLLPTKLKVLSANGGHVGGILAKGLAASGEDPQRLSDGVFSPYLSAPVDAASEEVRGQTRLLCDMLEFAEDVHRTTTRASQPAVMDGLGLNLSGEGNTVRSRTATFSELSVLASGLSSAISSSVQVLFLDTILYPSMLECSDQDGSSTAVLTYLDAILSVLSPDVALSQCIVSWLVGLDVTVGEDGHRFGKPRRSKRKSTAMLQLEQEKISGAAFGQPTYFSDVHGRYTIRDLIVDNLQPSTHAMAIIAALRLSSTLFTFHGRYALRNAMQIDEDDSATAFPTSLLHGREDALRRMSGDDEIKGELDSRLERVIPSTLDLVKGSNTTLNVHDLERYTSMICRIQMDKMASNGDDSLSRSTALHSTDFDNYLEDAESGIRQDRMFIAALRSVLQIASEEVSSGAQEQIDLRHRISPRDRLTRAALSCLTRYWRNPPDVNVALTGFIAALLSCPMRSLEGFVTSERKKDTPEGGVADGRRPYLKEDDEDDRSDDELEFLQKQLAASTSPGAKDSDLRIQEPVILCILTSLVDRLSAVRHDIDNFDEAFVERRNSLLFMENLDEAMEASAGDGSDAINKTPVSPFNVYIRRASKEKASKKTGGGEDVGQHVKKLQTSKVHGPIVLPLPPSATPSQGVGNGVEADKKTGKDESGSEPSTFARLFGRRSAKTSQSRTPDVSKGASETDAPLAKPFAQHYLQTARIGVEVQDVLLASHSPWNSVCAVPPSEGEEDLSLSGGVQVGTRNEKRTRFKDAGEENDEGAFLYPGHDSDDDTGSAKGLRHAARASDQDAVPPVSLSMLLDNAVVLEEFIKEVIAILLVRRAYGVDAAHIDL